MIAPVFPKDEAERQKAVEKYQLLDSLSEKDYDDITDLIAYICDAPVALITLLDKDRNFLKSHHGIAITESPREISFCGHAINTESTITVVENATNDERFHDNPLVTELGVRFYAGVPVVNPDGFKLGTLCVYDMKPRLLNQQQQRALHTLANQVGHLFEERYKNLQLETLTSTLEERNKNLSSFAYAVSHDLKSPLNNIIGLSKLLNSAIDNDKTLRSKEYVSLLQNSSSSLKNYIDGLLEFYQASTHLKTGRTLMSIDDLESEILELVTLENDTLLFSGDGGPFSLPKAAILQILLNLITNGFKYNQKENRKVEVSISQTEEDIAISVADNGEGIAENELKRIFNLFATTDNIDRFGNKGTGIGLASVQKLIRALGGEIVVTSVLGAGSTFSFNLPKN